MREAGRQAGSAAAGPRSAEEQEQEQQEEEQEHTNDFWFTLVSNSFAQLSSASCKAFPI